MAEFGTQILMNVPFFGTPFVIVALSGILYVMAKSREQVIP